MNARLAAFCTLACLATHAAFAAAGCDLAGAPAVPVIKGLSYDQARAALLAAGWQPGHGSQFTDMAGNQSVFHERGYTELQSCDFTQGAPCHFRFVGRGNVELKVVTTGEENPLLDSKATVSGAEIGCAE